MESEILMVPIQEPKLKGGKAWWKRGFRDWERAENLILLVMSMVTIFSNAEKTPSLWNRK